MEDFDVFTDEIRFTKPLFKNILNKFVNEAPATPSGPNYQSGRKLLGTECLSNGDELNCAFQFSEAVSATLRTLAVYRDEQMRAASDKLYKITSFIQPVQDLINANPISKENEELLNFLCPKLADVTEKLTEKLQALKIEEEPFHKKYLRFGPHNNTDNLQKILKELPKEWTIVQLTTPYNSNENLKPFNVVRTEIDSIYLTMYTNDYLGDHGPLTVNIPANVHKEGTKPLFTELYSLLDDNVETIDKASSLNNKRLVQNYWSRREDIDLRMKSVIMTMDKEWLGGWGALLTGRLLQRELKDNIIKLVDTTIADWGFIKLNTKQKILLYNLIESSPVLSSHQLKSCIRKILTQHGNTEEIRKLLDYDCQSCNTEFRLLDELCLKCLSKAFESIHHFTVVDGIKAFSQAAMVVKDGEEWAALRKAKRYPVILIVDEMLDTFPWETLPILNHHPVSRMENIHFLYNLYKMHENKFVDGYFVSNAEVGRYVINPEKNLDSMEQRMVSFVRYWCGRWRGCAGQAPPPDCFITYLREADVFLYCGHGDGCQFGAGGPKGVGVEAACGIRDVSLLRSAIEQYCGHGDGCQFGAGGANGVGIEAACGTTATALLSGCGSVRLNRGPGRAPPAASHHHLHVAGCPMVIGMLWEVTDLEVDKMVSTLVSLYVPSTAAHPWPSVGKAKWSQGVLDTDVEATAPFIPEHDLLRAMCRARGSTNFLMIASSIVARGLPVRIPD